MGGKVKVKRSEAPLPLQQPDEANEVCQCDICRSQEVDPDSVDNTQAGAMLNSEDKPYNHKSLPINTLGPLPSSVGAKGERHP